MEDFEEKGERKKILLVKNESPYDIQRFLLKRAQEILEKDYDVCFYEYDEEMSEDFDNSNYIKLLSDKEFDLIVTVDLTGFGQRLLEDDAFYNTLYCPMINLLTREAWHFSHFLNDRYNFTMYFYNPFQDSVDYINGVMKHFPNIEKLPPLGFAWAEPKPFKERRYGVYFPSGYEDPSRIREEIKSLPPVFARIAADVAKAMRQDIALSLYEALKRYLKKAGFQYEPPEFIDMIYEIRRVNTYIKMYHADACVRALLRENVPVAVSGKGWEAFNGEQGRMPQIIGRGGLDYEEMLCVMADSRIVLNNQIHKKGGVHTRVVNAMLQGAVSLSDTDAEITRYFRDGDDMALYDSGNPGEMALKAAELLKDEDRAMEIARKGRETALKTCSLEKEILFLVRRQVEDSEW